MRARARFRWPSSEHFLTRQKVTPVISDAEGLTSAFMCTCRRMEGLTKDPPHFALLPTAHAMAGMPLCMFPDWFYNMTVHFRMHSTNADSNTQCFSCGKFRSDKGFLICPLCNAVQSLDPNITYFEMFDQDEKFELDLKDLEAKYKSLMKTLHPDLSHGKSMEEKENSAQLSALVTTAYSVLLKPIPRATYMLKLRGIRVEEEGTVTDSELIMEVMEIREALQSLPDRKTLEQLQKKATTRMDEWSEVFKSALKERNDTNAVGALQRMSYFGRVCEDINRELL